MGKKLLIISAFMLQAALCHAQMDIELQRLAMRQSTQRAQDRDSQENSVRVIAQLEQGVSLTQLSDKLGPLGVGTISDFGRVCVLSVPVRSLKATSDLKEVEYLSTDHKIRINNDAARADMQVDIAQNSAMASDFGLDSTYDGTGVLVGIVDVGIDFNHAAFRDKDGNTRIEMAQIYDTREGATPKDMEAVRQTFTDPDEIMKLTSDGAAQSHGSHTSCTAAGTPVTLNDGTVIQGMAPKAGLLLSSMYCEVETYDSYCMDAIYSQIQYAEKVGKPVVINLSLGEITVFRDNKDPINTFIESVTGPGRIICFSSGNEANKSYCLEYTPKSDTDTLRTILYEYGSFYKSGMKANIVGYDETPFEVRLGCIDMMADTDGLPFEFFSLEDDRPIPQEEVIFSSNDSNHDNRFAALIDLPKGYTISKDFPYLIYVEVIGRKGKPFRISSDYTILYGGPSICGGKYTTGSNENCHGRHCETDSVISVGSYVSREKALSWEGAKLSSTSEFETPSSYSSFGTTIYGKCIPDVLAPGEFVLSAFNVYDIGNINQQTMEPNPRTYIYGYSDLFGRKSYYGWMRGTSMACPCATGVIALWLQANPQLGPGAVRDILKKTSLVTQDMEYGYSPLVYGNGMIRAAEGLRLIEGKPTGVPSITVPSWSSSEIYNLNSRIYILNGKKYLR